MSEIKRGNSMRFSSKKKSFRGIIDSKQGELPDMEDMDPLIAASVMVSRQDAEEGTCGRIIRGITTLIQKYSLAIFSFLVIVLTIGLELVIHDYVFMCPCSIVGNYTSSTSVGHRFTTGFVFLAVPPGILFMIGVGLSRRTWKLVTGCMNKTERTRNDLGTVCNVIVEVFLISMVAPVVWLVTGFLQADYYTCALSSAPCAKDPDSMIMNAKYRTESQVIGLTVTLAAAIATVVVMIGHRCRNKASYYHQQFLAMYQKSERQEMIKLAKEYGKQNARHEWCKLIKTGTEVHWDAVSRFYFPPDPDDESEDRTRRPFLSSLDKTVLQSLASQPVNNKVAPNSIKPSTPSTHPTPSYREESEIKYAPANHARPEADEKPREPRRKKKTRHVEEEDTEVRGEL